MERVGIKTWIDDDVDIGAIVVADESIMPISYVETSAHIVEGEELRTHSGVDVYLASETDFCQGGKMWSESVEWTAIVTTAWRFGSSCGAQSRRSGLDSGFDGGGLRSKI